MLDLAVTCSKAKPVAYMSEGHGPNVGKQQERVPTEQCGTPVGLFTHMESSPRAWFLGGLLGG